MSAIDRFDCSFIKCIDWLLTNLINVPEQNYQGNKRAGNICFDFFFSDVS